MNFLELLMEHAISNWLLFTLSHSLDMCAIHSFSEKVFANTDTQTHKKHQIQMPANRTLFDKYFEKR